MRGLFYMFFDTMRNADAQRNERGCGGHVGPDRDNTRGQTTVCTGACVRECPVKGRRNVTGRYYRGWYLLRGGLGDVRGLFCKDKLWKIKQRRPKPLLPVTAITQVDHGRHI